MRLGILRFGLVVVLENIRQTKRPELEPGIRQTLVGCNRQHMRAEAADRAFLYRDEQLVVRRKLADKLKVQRLGEPHVRNRGRKPQRIQMRPSRFRLAKPGADRNKTKHTALPDDSA